MVTSFTCGLVGLVDLYTSGLVDLWVSRPGLVDPLHLRPLRTPIACAWCAALPRNQIRRGAGPRDPLPLECDLLLLQVRVALLDERENGLAVLDAPARVLASDDVRREGVRTARD
jgi:hypothetical protein